jgi:phosphatidylinositol alpha-1,6-mannosyltransferase
MRGAREDQVETVSGAVEENPVTFPRDQDLYDNIERTMGVNLRGKKVLISVGRCVRRKGFDIFISDVFQYLPDDFVYIIISPKIATPPWIRAIGPMLGKKLHHNLLLASGAITMHADLVRLSRHHSRIFYLNGASQHQRDLLMSASDLFIMPNRRIVGDMEGFGLVALEAASRGLPVVATGIEGITDAVIHGGNGFCVSENDWSAMRELIIQLTADPCQLRNLSVRTREFTLATFSREKVFGRYTKIFNSLLESNGRSS